MYFPYLFRQLLACMKCPGSLLAGDGLCSLQLCPWRWDIKLNLKLLTCGCLLLSWSIFKAVKRQDRYVYGDFLNVASSLPVRSILSISDFYISSLVWTIMTNPDILSRIPSTSFTLPAFQRDFRNTVAPKNITLRNVWVCTYVWDVFLIIIIYPYLIII